MYVSSILILFLVVLNIIIYYIHKHQEEDEGHQETSSLSSSLDQHSLDKQSHGETNDSSLSSSSSDKRCRRFSLAEIRLATQNFDDAFVIGKGGFGEVYKGKLDFGEEIDVAIKRSNLDFGQGATEFWAEIEMLSKFRHSHIVSLLGYCEESSTKEMILVYEYMPNGSLEDHLHKRKANSSPLTWVQRLHICIGASRGLDYLHTGTGTQCRVIHRDIKSSNILLDENLVAKLSDFGLSRTGPAYHLRTTDVYTNQIRGTFGYIDAEYFVTHRLTRKSDVYAFGVVLFEVLCGRRAVDLTLDEQRHSLAGWAKHCVKKGTIAQIVDPYLRGQVSARCLKEFSQIAYKCLNKSPKDRPTMAEVVAWLEFVLSATLQKQGGTTIIKNAWSFFPIKIPGVHTKIYNNKNKQDMLDKEATTMEKEDKSNDNENKQDIPDKEVVEGHTLSHNLKVFTFDELKRAARNFHSSAMLGVSDVESVYKGWVDEKSYAPSLAGVGKPVAIKILNTDNIQNTNNWQEEINRGKYSHPNLVKLLGYCSEDRMLYLILGQFPWYTAMKIVIGTARGLTFLHNVESSPAYRTFNSSNILLNKTFEAQIYFGSAALNHVPWVLPAETSDTVTGHYTPPEHVTTGQWSLKSDIYAFGVLMLDMMVGSHFHHQYLSSYSKNLVEWARPILSNTKKLHRAMKPWLEQDAPPKGVSKVGALVLSCLEADPDNRPPMEHVLARLERIKVVFGMKEW